MLILLYGQDTYRSREELKKIIKEQEKNCLAGRQANLNWFNFVRIDARDSEIEIFEQIRQSTNTVSMFNEKKLIVIENIFSAPLDIQKNLSEFLKGIAKDPDTIIVFWAEEIEEKNELFKILKTRAEIKKFDLLKGVQLKNWVKDHILEQEGKIEAQALSRIIEYVGSDLWRITNEISKLLNYDKEIKLENVELLVKPEIDLNIFNLVDALGQKNKQRALGLFNQHIEKGEDDFYLLSMFIYQIRNLLRIKSTPVAKLDLHPFVIRKTKYQAENFTFEELKKIYYQLMTIDLEAKTGKADITTALELFLAKV